MTFDFCFPVASTLATFWAQKSSGSPRCLSVGDWYLKVPLRAYVEMILLPYVPVPGVGAGLFTQMLITGPGWRDALTLTLSLDFLNSKPPHTQQWPSPQSAISSPTCFSAYYVLCFPVQLPGQAGSFFFFFFCFFSFFLKTGFLWLSWNFLNRPDWAQTHRFSFLCLPSVGIKGMYYHHPANINTF